MAKVYFIDVTNRDGVQTSRISLSKLQKTMLNIYLSQIGVHQSEMGFPFTRHEKNYIRANVALKRKGAMGFMVLSGWARAIVRDVSESLDTGINDMNISISTSDQMIIHKFKGKLDKDKVISEMVAAVVCAREGGIKTLGVNAEDASRTDMSYLIEFAHAAKEAGADRIRYCDTIGGESPAHIYERVKTLAESVKLPIELHCHQDLGMSVANSVAGAQGAIDAGVDAWINTVINGIGERAGQADLLSCVLAFKLAFGLGNYELADAINLKMAWKLAKYISYAFDIPLPINQVGVGANAFAHESGIHADGALKDRQNYELYDYELLGRGEDEINPTGRIITMGEYGGIAGFRHVCAKLGIEFPDDKSAQRVLELTQYANAHNQLPLTDDEIHFIAQYPDEAAEILTITPSRDDNQ